MQGFQDLIVWQKAMEMAREAYAVTDGFPKNEVWGLVQQIRRAAVSVPSNIAEGHSRQSTGDYRRHLQLARGSVAELQTQLILAEQLNMTSRESTARAMELADECSRILATLIGKFRT